MKLLIATTNQNKLGQFRAIFRMYRADFELLSLADIDLHTDVEEDKNSEIENAKKKAQFFGEKTRLLCLSDDLGLYIDELNGAPGLHAKRWHPGTDEDRRKFVLEKLKGLPKERRKTKYVGAIAIYNPEKKEFWTYEKEVKGIIIKEPKGEVEFGYDQIFYSEELGKNFGEASEEEKAEISHRGLGIRKFIEQADNLL